MLYGIGTFLNLGKLDTSSGKAKLVMLRVSIFVEAE